MYQGSICFQMRELLLFIKKPEWSGSFTKLSIKTFVHLLILYLICVVPLGAIASVFAKILDLNSKVDNVLIPKEILYGFVLAPLIEEVFFRLIYVFRRRNLFIILCASLFFAIVFIFRDSYSKSILLFSVAFILILTIIFFNFSKQYFYSHFKFFFYFIAFLFAIIHLNNFIGLTYTKLLFGLLLVTPQLIAGIVLGYIRLKYGFIYAVLYHMTINLVLLFQL